MSGTGSSPVAVLSNCVGPWAGGVGGLAPPSKIWVVCETLLSDCLDFATSLALAANGWTLVIRVLASHGTCDSKMSNPGTR
eukprot:scaffold1098_cov417-Prasinococcus_capsulatus_cf.AAC.12